ncbi:ABC transporter ATP-binding protein [Homoserinibacter sp. GY 40078]|uniref:ABC transporter ATP-binding protein n=1 Tax=Homoserinibacter sp. GY 40078 TaxID=2603275 RepID=UPI0011CB7C41|nr:ABC transporter ATP-binding protein [Homoserinibacter sp. GY 40078]TXK18703.1 ABC transporter ATP-binding protein [Homoserinibacter sp. GY 40078]
MPGATTETTTGAVELHRVTKHYGAQTAVDDLTLEIRPGEFLSLLGPSGCGKTTTLRMIAGFEHPDAGDILISGRSVLGTPPYRRDVNTVFQAYALFPHMTVAENVAYGLQQRRTPRAELRERVSQALDMVQMRGFADRKPTQLSGGQQQRVALARALVNRPAVLLLDEPLGALDRQLREEMQLELKLLQSQLGITFVFVTHDQDEALSMSDRIAVMRDGRIEQLADAQTVYQRPVSAYVAAFVGKQNFFDGTVTADGGAVEAPSAVLRPTDGITAVAAGQPARAAVRPEFVELGIDPPSAAVNRAEGEVIGVAHLGEMRQFLVQLDESTALLSRRPAPHSPDLTVGQRVWASWRPESVQVFARGTATTDTSGYMPPPTIHSDEQDHPAHP